MDYKKEGYTIDVYHETEPLRGKAISESKKLLYPINDEVTYNFKTNKAINSSLDKLKKTYGSDVIVISEMAENNGHSYYYAKDAPGNLFINEYFEIVDLRKLSDGKINVSKVVLPPPPPPLSPLEFIEANKADLVYYKDDKKISYETAKWFIERTGQDNIEVSPDAEGKMAIKIKMTEEKRKLLPPPPPPAKKGNSGNSAYKLTDEQAITLKNELYEAMTLKI